MTNEICPLCGKKCKTQPVPEHIRERFVSCDSCGKFKISESIFEAFTSIDDLVNSTTDSSIMVVNPKIINRRCNLIYEFLLRKPLYHTQMGNFYYRFFYEERTIGQPAFQPWSINVAENMQNYPKNVNEKINRILLNLSHRFPHIGDEFGAIDLLPCMLFVETERPNIINNITNKEKNTLIDFLVNSNYLIRLERNNGTEKEVLFKLSVKAWEKIGILTQDNSENRDVFVAMSFHESATPIREAIRKAIVSAGFSATFMDEIIHNHQIIPEMLRLIKECRFLIMDITDPNYGAYYETGFAMGLGKEAIITCRKDIHDKKDYKDHIEKKALMPHFDIAQKQLLIWENEADLTKKLQEWIKYIFPN